MGYGVWGVSYWDTFGVYVDRMRGEDKSLHVPVIRIFEQKTGLGDHLFNLIFEVFNFGFDNVP